MGVTFFNIFRGGGLETNCDCINWQDIKKKKIILIFRGITKVFGG